MTRNILRGGTYRQRLARILAALAIVLGMVLLVAPAPRANADCSSSVLSSLGLGDLKEPPVPAPAWPNAGISGMLADTPDMASIPDTAPDPFTDKTVTMASVYGHQYGWSTYDTGCIPDPVAAAQTSMGSMVMGINAGLTQLLQSIDNIATKGDLSWLHHAVAIAATSLEPLVLGGANTIGWLPLALIAAGIIVGWRASNANYAETAQRFGIALLTIAACVGSVIYPAELARKMDNIVTGVSTTTAASTGQSVQAADLVARSADYKGWLAGQFGDPTSPTATKYGATIFDATHYTWSDVKKITNDPGSQKSIAEAKANKFRAAVKEIKNSDPATYAQIQGHGDRIGPALLTGFTGFLMSLFIFCAKVIVAVCRVMMPALVIAGGFIAMMGMLRGRTGTLMSLWDILSAALIETAKQSLGAIVMIRVLAALAESNLSGGATIFWMIVATIVGFALLKPLHAFKTIVPGLDPNKSYVRSAASTAMHAGMNYLGARKGAHDGIEDAANDIQQQHSAPAPAPTVLSHDTHSLPALEYVPQDTQNAWHGQQETWHVQQVHPQPEQPTTTAWAGIAPNPATATPESLPAGPTAPQRLDPGVQHVEIPQRTVYALPVGTTTSTATMGPDATSLGTATPPIAPLPAGPAPSGAAQALPAGVVHVLPVIPAQGDLPVTQVTTEGGHTVTVQQAPAPEEPIVPSSGYTQRPTTLYTAGSTPDVDEVDIWDAEPVIDENGVEHYEVVLYQSERTGAEQ